MKGRVLFSPEDMNKAFDQGFRDAEWQKRRNAFWITSDEKILRSIYNQSADKQKAAIESAGYEPRLIIRPISLRNG